MAVAVAKGAARIPDSYHGRRSTSKASVDGECCFQRPLKVYYIGKCFIVLQFKKRTSYFGRGSYFLDGKMRK